MESQYLENNETKTPSSNQNNWFVYAIECNNGSVYIGQTKNLLNRWKQHKKGTAARWTKKHEPVQLFYYEIIDTFKKAIKREKELKKTNGRKFLKDLLDCSKVDNPTEELLKQIKIEKEKNL